jgi:hypothetical protein
VVKLKIVVLQ